MYLNKQYYLDFLCQKEITWSGIDFSQATFTKDGFDLQYDLLQYYFSEWNKFIITDQKKYNLRISFRKPIIQYDLSTVKKCNQIPKNKLSLKKFINIDNTFDDLFIEKYIKNLTFPKNTKYNIYFIVESLDSILKNAAIWVTIIKTDSNEIVLSEKFLEKPAGLSTKTYWARVFYNIIYKIKDDAYPRWENYVKENN